MRLPCRYPEITLAALADADRVFLADEPFPFEAKHISEIASATSARVEVISGDDCCWHGVRSIRGVARMRALVAGDLG